MTRETVRIVKLSGAGNDFVALGPEGIAALGSDLESWTRRVCRRGLSVGADGVLLVEPAGEGRVRVRFHNPDGSPAFCGNGCRCAARFARLEGFAGETMHLETLIGEVPAEIVSGGVRLTLPPPQDLGELQLTIGGEALHGRRVRAGVPHFVVFVDDVAAAPLERWGPAVRRHPSFGHEGTNLDLAESRGGDALSIRTWERGVENETLSCGTGAIASAFAAWLDGRRPLSQVLPAGGVPLTVTFRGTPESPEDVMLAGDARVIFDGRLDREAIIGFGDDD